MRKTKSGRQHGACWRGLALLIASGCGGGGSGAPSDWEALGTLTPTNQRPDERFLPALAVDPTSDQPVVALRAELETTLNGVRVMAWDGEAWVDLASPPVEEQAQNVAIAVGPDGVVWLAWTEATDFQLLGRRAFVMRWDGAAWTQVGDELAVTIGAETRDPSIAIDSTGLPWVAWSENPGDGARFTVHVKHWDGAAWLEVGGDSLDVGPDYDNTLPVLVLGAGDRPTLAWDAIAAGEIWSDVVVKQWDGAAWISLGILDGGGDAYPRAPALAVGPDGTTLYASYRVRGAADTGAGADHDLRVERWDGASWTGLGGAVDLPGDANVESTAIAVDADDRPVVGWSHEGIEEGTGRSGVHVARWDGAAWQALDGLGDDGNAFDPAIAVDGAGAPILVWDDGRDFPRHAAVRRWLGDE